MGYDEALALRKQQQEETQNLKENPEEEDPDELEDDNEVKASIAGNYTFQQVHKNAKKEDAKLEDFEMMRIVGKGTFGKVFQVMHKKTKKVYAMKCIRKDVVLENEQMDSLKLEKEILYSIEHPFIVGMDYVFENNLRIFFLMDFIEGGELFRHLVQVRRFPEDQARFMIAQVAIALGHLHEKNIVYRDLKPENVLFNRDGYLLLADFGLATKVDKDKLATSFCGTAEYLSPEMLNGDGHDHTVDWWTLGILLYEMLVGIPPFFNKNKHKMYFLIKEHKVTFPVPEKHNIYVSPEAADLINKLLMKKKDERIGAKGGVQEILAHPFFKDLDIQALLQKKLEPGYKPQINDGELKYFDQRLIKDQSIEMSVVPADRQKFIGKQKAAFDGF